MDILSRIISSFAIEGEPESIEPYGEGHINVTYLAKTSTGNAYILQKINNRIFPDVDGLMNNIESVTSYLREVIRASHGDESRETMRVVKTRDGKLYHHEEASDSYYRVYVFVQDAVTLQSCSSKELFRASAEGFARFAMQLAGFDASKLVEPIPNFHNTERRYAHFLEVLEKDSLLRVSSCQAEIDFVKARAKDVGVVNALIREGKIPLRVTHNDTKLNNILLDAKTMKPLCVIDLDTIMPGSILFDFGDSIRFGCNSAAENEKDLSKVDFLTDYFEAFVDGYLSNLGGAINETELEFLAFGAKLMTLECGIRFLDDYLDGDHYFRIHFEDENLVRARTQFKLVSLMEEKMDELNEIVRKHAK